MKTKLLFILSVCFIAALTSCKSSSSNGEIQDSETESLREVQDIDEMAIATPYTLEVDSPDVDVETDEPTEDEPETDESEEESDEW